MTPLEISIPPGTDCITLECTEFIPPILPEDNDPPSMLRGRPESTDEPQKKKRRVKAVVSKSQEPSVAFPNRLALKGDVDDEYPQPDGPTPGTQPNDPHNSVIPAHLLTPGSITDSPDQEATSKSQPEGVPLLPELPPVRMAPFAPQSSWRPSQSILARPTTVNGTGLNGHGLTTILNARERTKPIEVGSSSNLRF